MRNRIGRAEDGIECRTGLTSSGASDGWHRLCTKKSFPITESSYMRLAFLYVVSRCLLVLLLLGTAAGCHCFNKGDDESSSGSPAEGGSAGGGGGGGGTGGGGGGGGGGGNGVPEIDPSALRGGLAVLVCGTLILIDRRLRTRPTATAAA